MFGNDHDDNAATPDVTTAQDTGTSGFNPALPPPDHSFAPQEPSSTHSPSPTQQDEPSGIPPVDVAATDQPAPDDHSASDDADDTTSTAPEDDKSGLLDIKQQALSQLSPLVSQLDQAPEDKFKTIMMMIQANDNQSLIKDAYEAAQAIPDEKEKAQALLDVVNEINYFTHKDDE